MNLVFDAGHIDLAQAHAGRLALLDPPDGGQQPIPVIREPQRPHRMAGQPRDQAGAAGSLDQPGQAADLGTHPQQRPDLLVVVQPSAAGDAVRAEVPAADLPVLNAQRAARGGNGPLGGPLADLGQVLADLAGGRPRIGIPSGSQSWPTANRASSAPESHFFRTAARTSARRVHRPGPSASGPSRARAAGTSAPGRGDEVADLDLLSDLVRGPPGLVLVDGERLQPRIVAVRVVDEAPADTYGSMTWIFCSGVTISNCRPSRPNSSSANRVDSSEPRPNASSMTANQNVRDFAAPHSSLNW